MGEVCYPASSTNSITGINIVTNSSPVWNRYTISDLHTRTGYSESYLLRVRDGHLAVTDLFRTKIAAALNEDVAALFDTAAA